MNAPRASPGSEVTRPRVSGVPAPAAGMRSAPDGHKRREKPEVYAARRTPYFNVGQAPCARAKHASEVLLAFRRRLSLRDKGDEWDRFVQALDVIVTPAGRQAAEPG